MSGQKSNSEAGESLPQEQQGISRRKFLKILGSTAAVGAATGCTDSAVQSIFPNVQGTDDQIPGVSVWYNTTCSECSAGCGIQVRTREGRAVKIEGNPDHPINRGGVCAIGHSALQNLYDPDRVRSPMVKRDGVMGTADWESGLSRVAGLVKANAGKQVMVTGQLGATLGTLVTEWCKVHDVEQVSYELISQAQVAQAAKLSYGVEGIPTYAFSKADVVVNFGADFLETWLSPCEFARDWADTRKTASPMRVVQIEPRLSLTGANADHWIRPKPGTELLIALALLKLLAQRGKGVQLDAKSAAAAKISELTAGISIQDVEHQTGVTSEKLLLVTEYLSSARASLVLAGGASTATQNPLPLMVVVNLINMVLGNVGKTVNIAEVQTSSSNPQGLVKLIDRMNKGEIRAAYFYGVNPVFSLPSSFGLKYAIKKVDSVVSFGSHLDDTAALADTILPSHTALESWGDTEPRTGLLNLSQPVMTPVFDTRSFGDTLLQLAAKTGKDSIAGGAKTFEEYLKNTWQKRHATLASGIAPATFAEFWSQSVERGGFVSPAATKVEAVRVAPELVDLAFVAAEFDSRDLKTSDLILYPYPSVRSFDGREANRPWLQEVPDPITQVVWDSWAEIHPVTAAARGIAQGDMVTIRNHYGEINVAAFITENVDAGIIAVPIGQGHAHYGRYAQSVAGGNVLELLPPLLSKDGTSVPLLSTRVEVIRGRGSAKLVRSQGSDSQQGRELARTAMVAGAGTKGHHDDHHDDDHSHGAHHHHEPKQMYEQREHPLYQWGLSVDLAACTGCSACVVACYAENNIPVVGKQVAWQGREMAWLRIERYIEGTAEEMKVSFLPMMCQHCQNAPCEPVCPVYATYHNEEGLNSMVYNRCVGTRYCSNNCSYKVRRFNWFEYEIPEPMNLQLNPDVVKRTVGVMEKCTFCVQRINEGKDRAKDLGRPVQDGEIQPACVQSCPTKALSFGNLNDPKSAVSKAAKNTRAYKVLDHHLNTQPSVVYLEDKRVKV